MIGLCGFIPLSLLAFVRQGKILHELAEMGGEKFTLVDNASRMLRNPEDTARYFLMCAIVTAVQLLLVLLYAGLLRVLTNVIHRYTGLSVTGKDEERLNETHRMLFRRLLAAMILGAVSAVFSAVYAWTLPYAVGTFMEVFGMIDVILHAVFVLFYFRAASCISEEIEYRYLLS